MAYDKVIDSAQLEADLTAVADAIREKGETTALLAWPEEYIIAIGDISGGGSGGYPENVYNFAYTNEDDSITLTWTDTEDADWAGTLIVAKQGSYPTDIDDGIVIVDSKVRSQYAAEGYTYSGLAEGEWYLQAFPYSAAGEVSDNIVNRLPVTVAYIYPSPLTSFKVSGGNTTATITYTLPEDATGVDVVYKTGGYPASITDGALLPDIDSGYVVTGLNNDTTYYFRAFPENIYGRYNSEIAGNTATATPARGAKITITCMHPGDLATVTLGEETAEATADEFSIAEIMVLTVGTWQCYVNGYNWGKATVTYIGEEVQRPAPRFGYRKDMADSNPATRITYLYDAEGLTPAKMDFTNGVFDYGDWADYMAVKGNYPVMLKYDGTEDYKLNPDDYAYKEDGVTPSDVSNTAYEGNAMSAHPRMWVHRYQDDTYQYCIFCPIQWDENYRADAFINHDGWLGDRMYMPCFKGALVDGRLRSMMGLAPQASTTAAQEVEYAAACNPEGKTLWTVIPWSRRAYINDLLVLLGRSTDTQAVYGQGSVSHSVVASGLCQTGTLAAMGQFFGYSTAITITQVKVLHMEGVWGDRWDRAVGLVNNSGKILVKMAPPYSLTDFADYVDAGITPGGTSGGYISETVMGELGNIPKTASGSATTYEADSLWFNNGTVAIPFVGCDCHSSNAAGMSGAFALYMFTAASHAAWSIGASPSCDQPTPEGVAV